MLKDLMPVAIYSISVLFKKESFKNETMANMLSISFNVAIAACVRPNSTFERDDSSFHLEFVIFGTDSFCAFAFNLVVFLLSGKTLALTMNIAEVVKY
ncbi:hypothetical protein AHAS_Ahas13G0363600 [Arachis hypogaea]